MIDTGTSLFKPWMAARSPQEAELLSRLGAASFAAYAVLATALYVATGGWHDYRIFIPLLGFDLAIAAGIFLKSRFFASLAVLLCVARIIQSIVDFESVGETGELLTLGAMGLLAAQAGVRGSFGLRKYGGSSATRSRWSSLALISLFAMASLAVVAWLGWFELYSANG